MFIVSVVSDKEMESLSGNETSHQMNDNNHQRFTLFKQNQHDPHVMGTVVFRGHPFPKICQLGKDEVSLIMESYPTLFSQCRTKNQGTFHMIGKRQSYLSILSMGGIGNRTEHNYFNN